MGNTWGDDTIGTVDLQCRIDEATAYIQAQRLWQPAVAIVLGSGLGKLAEHVQHATSVPYASIPHFSTTSAAGHAGTVICGYLAGLPVVLLQGRAHRYEGISNSQASFPVRCARALGADILITTNAAGGLNPRFQTGDLMVLDSHIDFLWPRGQFESICQSTQIAPRRTPPYDWNLLTRARELARLENITLHQGCYLATLGPTYETRSEYRMFRWTGADAVGMSTLPEVLAAQELSMRVLAFSVITNVASTDIPQTTTHAEVVDVGQAVGPRLLRIVSGLLEDLSGQPD